MEINLEKLPKLPKFNRVKHVLIPAVATWLVFTVTFNLYQVPESLVLERYQDDQALRVLGENAVSDNEEIARLRKENAPEALIDKVRTSMYERVDKYEARKQELRVMWMQEYYKFSLWFFTVLGIVMFANYLVHRQPKQETARPPSEQEILDDIRRVGTKDKGQ